MIVSAAILADDAGVFEACKSLIKVGRKDLALKLKDMPVGIVPEKALVA